MDLFTFEIAIAHRVTKIAPVAAFAPVIDKAHVTHQVLEAIELAHAGIYGPPSGPNESSLHVHGQCPLALQRIFGVAERRRPLWYDAALDDGGLSPWIGRQTLQFGDRLPGVIQKVHHALVDDVDNGDA